MKYSFVTVLGLTVLMLATGCKDNSRYVDPNTGHGLTLVKDANTGLMVDQETKKPVYIYVDTEKKDTIYGETGKVINGQVTLQDGKYKFAEESDADYKIVVEDYKQKVEKDGDIKIKTDDEKIKIDGKTGEVKKK